jgi:hypothetical protein
MASVQARRPRPCRTQLRLMLHLTFLLPDSRGSRVK